MRMKITPKIFRSVYNRAIFEIVLKGLLNKEPFEALSIQSDFFTEEDYLFLRDTYKMIYLLIVHSR